ncbi:MAG: DUF2961 domain-containing protein [Eubacteriales bacterium]|nr:DUF2961 domain-containing protein [Eubacteriales bacterium]
MLLEKMNGLEILEKKQSRAVNAENHTGQKGMGGCSTDGAAKACARELGQGWKVSPYFIISPGVEFCLADVEGPGQIESMWFGGNMSRNYILRLYWEGNERPGVECPLPEFFAYGWQKDSDNPFAGPFYPLNSAVVAVNPNKGMNCFWPMPFRKHCRITIENRTEKEYVCYYQINYCLKEIPANAGYFHAQYRQKKGMGYKEEYVILDGVKGSGKYVGTALFAGLNGEGNWWGEGEMKFYLDDDDKFPTICGTGTEDYFGGSYDWEVDGVYEMYNGLYMGMHQLIQSDGLYDHQTRFSMYRWHITDGVCFEKNIKVTLQDLGWKIPGGLYLSRRDDFASVAYWYQDSSALEKSVLPDEKEMFLA